MMTTAAHRDIRERAAGFHDQFIIARTLPDAPPGWRAHRFGEWHVVTHPSLPVIRLVAADGSCSGFALGHPIDANGRMVRGVLALPPADGDRFPSPAAIERWIYRLGGRFLFLIASPEMERLYLDPGGSLATVWCPRRKTIASTPTLILIDEPDHPLFRIGREDYPRNRTNLFFPAGLTAADGIARLITNHFIDLRQWTATRHYPLMAHEETSAAEIPQLVSLFHQIVRRQIGAMIQECGGAYLGLTSGQDSRRLLACARDFADRLECITLRPMVCLPDTGPDIDIHVATRLTGRVGIRHRILDMGTHFAGATADYLLRIGYSGGAGKTRKFWGPAMKHLDLSRAWMTGLGGELGKAVFCQRMALEKKPTAEDLLRVMRLPPQPGFAEALEAWLAGLPEGSPAFYLNMAHLEHRVGAWGCAHLYGAAPFRVILLPVAHREVIDAMLRLPTPFKIAGGLTRGVASLAWPDLLALPFNEYDRLTRWRHQARTWVNSIGAMLRRR